MMTVPTRVYDVGNADFASTKLDNVWAVLVQDGSPRPITHAVGPLADVAVTDASLKPFPVTVLAGTSDTQVTEPPTGMPDARVPLQAVTPGTPDNPAVGVSVMVAPVSATVPVF